MPQAHSLLTKHEYERYLLLPSLTTDAGRGRAWLRSTWSKVHHTFTCRSVLNEQSLERHLHLLLGDTLGLQELYDEWAFLRDEERASMLPPMAAGLTSIRFALRVDNPELNSENQLAPASLPSLSSLLPSALVPQAQLGLRDPTIAAEVSTEHTVISTRPKVKKKKRPRATANIVSFEEQGSVEEAVEEAVDYSGSGLGSEVSSPSPAPASYSTPAEVQATLDSLLALRLQPSTSSGVPSPFSAVSSPSLSQPQPSTSSTISSPSLSQPQPSTSPTDSFTFDYTAVRLDRAETESRLTGGIYDGGEQVREKVATPRKRARSPSKADSEPVSLTPVTNLGVGALYPVTGGSASGSSECGPQSGEEEPGEDYALPRVQAGHDGDTFHDRVSVGRGSLGSQSSGGLAGTSGRGGREAREETSTLGREDLKAALLSVLEKKDVVEDQCRGLRGLLEQEQEAGQELRGEVATLRQRCKEVTDRLEVGEDKMCTLVGDHTGLI